eukprot:3158831-Rhodomonas_salina.3
MPQGRDAASAGAATVSAVAQTRCDPTTVYTPLKAKQPRPTALAQRQRAAALMRLSIPAPTRAFCWNVSFR